MLNTHYYDGKLNKIPSEMAEVDINEKRKQFSLLKDRINTIENVPHKQKLFASNIIDVIEKDIGTKQNYDATNDNYADVLLYQLCMKIFKDKNIEVDKLLIEQLADVFNGSCSQGRCTRLYQILIAISS